jgi:hypothetical protein
VQGLSKTLHAYFLIHYKTPAPHGDRGFGLPEAAGSPVSHNSQGGGRCEYTLVEYGFAKIRNCFLNFCKNFCVFNTFRFADA